MLFNGAEFAKLGANVAADAESFVDVSLAVFHAHRRTADSHTGLAALALVLVDLKGREVLDIFKQSAGTAAYYEGGLFLFKLLGNDLAAAEGTPVLAAADGVVRIAGSHKSYGSYLRLLHADGDETLYAHMQYLFVKAGETVTAGQILGTVGETGNATGPHLHFEILHKGLRYDPAQALQNAS